VLCLFTLEPSPFTPLLSLTADFQQKWQPEMLISPGTNPLQHLFDTGPEKPGEVRQFWAFVQVTDPSVLPETESPASLGGSKD
jgi:hypothetical protein